jgi:hypothetical protein
MDWMSRVTLSVLPLKLFLPQASEGVPERTSREPRTGGPSSARCAVDRTKELRLQGQSNGLHVYVSMWMAIAASTIIEILFLDRQDTRARRSSHRRSSYPQAPSRTSAQDRRVEEKAHLDFDHRDAFLVEAPASPAITTTGQSPPAPR